VAWSTDSRQSTIGLLAPLQDTARHVKEESSALETDALDRMGTAALWLSLLALVTLAMSALGGLLGTPEESLLEARSQSQSYMRRAS
jgi:cysteine sulfinate desulfinase/cysteine desulfurase-like protein